VTRLEGFVGAMEWIFTAVLAVVAGGVGDLYRRLMHPGERLARSEGAVPEILKRIEGTLNTHVADEQGVLSELRTNVQQLVTDVAVMKNGGRNG
jgi:hypothetical protein